MSTKLFSTKKSGSAKKGHMKVLLIATLAGVVTAVAGYGGYSLVKNQMGGIKTSTTKAISQSSSYLYTPAAQKKLDVRTPAKKVVEPKAKKKHLAATKASHSKSKKHIAKKSSSKHHKLAKHQTSSKHYKKANLVKKHSSKAKMTNKHSKKKHNKKHKEFASAIR
jgi:hypothetical protein